METITADVCVIGGGSGGLSIAAGAQQMGANVVLCEGGKMGGDCLNYGCVPSKALIEASRSALNAKTSGQFGVHGDNITIDYGKIHQHIHQVIAGIAPHDSVERFQGLGVKVIEHHASFKDRQTIEAGPYEIKAKYVVIATGSRAFIPPISGLSDIPYLTNETIFDLKEQPKTLAIIGGGPIGAELAQSFACLGSKVMLFEIAPQILGPVDNEAATLIKTVFKHLNIDIMESVTVKNIEYDEGEYTIHTLQQSYKATELLIATGRTPNIEKLNLDKAGIGYNNKGIQVDKRLRTNVKRIFAIGDVAGPYQFTHAASYQAGIVIRNMLFKIPAKVNYQSFPWVTYTTPEIAHTGLSIAEAEKKGANIIRFEYKDNDRARASLHTNGFIKVAIGKKGQILGATIVGDNAGELISPWTIAIQSKLKIKQMASFIAPYPTLSEINKRVAGGYFTPFLYSDKTKRLVRFLMRWF